MDLSIDSGLERTGQQIQHDCKVPRASASGRVDPGRRADGGCPFRVRERVLESAAMPSHFEIRTFGCQMNQHDAEKISNLLYHADYRPANAGQTPDLILLHTCSVREKAERKLYSELAELVPLKRRHPQLLIGVGGCVAQQEGA